MKLFRYIIYVHFWVCEGRGGVNGPYPLGCLIGRPKEFYQLDRGELVVFYHIQTLTRHVWRWLYGQSNSDNQLGCMQVINVHDCCQKRVFNELSVTRTCNSCARLLSQEYFISRKQIIPQGNIFLFRGNE